MSDNDYEGWAILELMGHRRLGGHLTAASIAGASLLKIDVYTDDFCDPSATQFYSPAAVYAITPCTEETARRVNGKVAPVAVWELPRPQLPAAVAAHRPDDEDDERVDVDAADYMPDDDDEVVF